MPMVERSHGRRHDMELNHTLLTALRAHGLIFCSFHSVLGSQLSVLSFSSHFLGLSLLPRSWSTLR